MKSSIREIALSDYLFQRQALGNPELSLFDFYYLTGARTSEPLLSSRGDLNFEKWNVFLHTEKNRRNSYRTVGLFDYNKRALPLLRSVQDYAESRPYDQLLWPFIGLKKPRNHIWTTCKQTFNCTTHSFRHTHAIMLVRELGFPMNELMSEMGWADMSSTIPYVQYENESSRRKRMGLDNQPSLSNEPNPNTLPADQPTSSFDEAVNEQTPPSENPFQSLLDRRL